MQKKWLYRFIMSYIPIFFAVIFCLIMLFFLGVNELTKQQSMKAYQVYAQQVMHIVDSTLQNIDTLASKSLLLNPKVAAYFDSAGEQSPYSYYGVTEVLLDFAAPLPMIDSVYLYRSSDGKILMQHLASELPEFGDRSFIEQAMDSSTPMMWSGVRTLSLFRGEEQPRPVVSLVKKVPYYSGAQGLIVINISAGSLQALVEEMHAGGGGWACLSDQNGSEFNNACVVQAGMENRQQTGDVTLASAYSGWQLQMEMPQGSRFSFLSTFSYVWFILGFGAVVGGLGAMTYLSHRHYRPIEQVLSRIHSFSARQGAAEDRREGRRSARDEFSFIDHALVSLIEQSNQFEQQQAQGMAYRRARILQELMEGSRPISGEELLREAALPELEASGEYRAAALLEMDAYADFLANYSARDQLLFKFTLRSAVQEMAEEEGAFLWTEWVTPSRLGLIYQNAGSGGERYLLAMLTDLAERARAWVEQYLKFTVTVGIGSAVREAAELRRSCSEARQAVDRKLSLGPNRVTCYDRQWSSLSDGAGVDTLLQELQEAAVLFRLGNPDWELLLRQAFQSIAAGVYSREDITGLIRMFKAQLKRELQELPPQLQEIWRSDGLGRLQALPEDPEWIGETRGELLELLGGISGRLQSLRMNREQYTLAAQVREYLAEHYARSDLSLSQVSEAFGMNQKTLSRIFKEEFGEKFVDYLAKVRVEQAKRLLTTTGEPVQGIAEKVGYLHPMSFIRVFKKVEGTTPGDFRRGAGIQEK